MVEDPTPAQLEILVQCLANERSLMQHEFERNDPIRRWPKNPESLLPIVAERLGQEDWYGDLSEQGKQLWETAFYLSCMRESDLDIEFRVDSDGVYWDVIDLILTELGDQPETPGESAMSRFGTVPFRYHPVARSPQAYWHPMHSMNPPDEVQRMVTELESVAPAVQASKNSDVQEQFTGELLPAIKKVADDGRLLFIQVDT